MYKGIDCHIHTFYQRCGNETLSVPNIIRRAESIGLKKIAITDHLNTLDRLERFNYIKADIHDVKTDVEVFFGVELNYQACDGEFAYNEKIHREYEFEVVIGGIHSTYTESFDPVEIIEIQHRHFMKTLENPLLDVLVHPFWFSGNTVRQRPPEFWENLLLAIPDDMIRSWAEAGTDNRCAIEVNAHAIFFHPLFSDRYKRIYVDLLKKLAGMGALFAVGSDAHDINTLGQSFYVEGILHGLGVSDDQIWKPRKESVKT